jgi:hypothetical protein
MSAYSRLTFNIGHPKLFMAAEKAERVLRPQRMVRPFTSSAIWVAAHMV